MQKARTEERPTKTLRIPKLTEAKAILFFDFLEKQGWA